MLEDQRINYVELPARDLDAAEAFYAKAFGWTFVDYGPEYRAFNVCRPQRKRAGRLVRHVTAATEGER